jgi:hypothetical protein
MFLNLFSILVNFHNRIIKICPFGFRKFYILYILKKYSFKVNCTQNNPYPPTASSKISDIILTRSSYSTSNRYKRKILNKRLRSPQALFLNQTLYTSNMSKPLCANR